MKPEDKSLLKGKMTHKVGYKAKAALLDEAGKNTLIEVIKNGTVCELREKVIFDTGNQALTIKFYFKPLEQ